MPLHPFAYSKSQFVLVALLLAALITVSRQTALAAPPLPPVAPLRPVTDTYPGGHTQVDPYQWMEDLASPDTVAWLKGQSDYSAAVLQSIPGRAALLAQIQALDSRASAYSTPLIVGRSAFYEELAAADQTEKLYVLDLDTRKPRLLLDPNLNAPPGTHLSIGRYSVSPDSEYVAVGTYPSGSELSTVEIINVATAQPLPERIARIRFGAPEWLPDSSGFFYNHLAPNAAGASSLAGEENSVVYLHKLATDASLDRPVFGYGVSALTDNSIDPASVSSVITSDVSPYVVGEVTHGTSRNDTLYAVLASQINGAATPWVKIVDVADDVFSFRFRESTIYLSTDKNARHGKLLAMSLAGPNLAAAKVIVPDGPLGLSDLEIAKDALYLVSTGIASSSVRRVGFDGGPITPLAFPDDGPVRSVIASPTRSGIAIRQSSWTHLSNIYRYNPLTGKVTGGESSATKLYAETSRLTSVEVRVPAKDGILIPLSIVYSKDAKLDGSHPTLLEAYGAYGESLNASFNPLMLAWYERGGVYAVAHVRGGGERGESWHLGGYKTTKANTWNDLIACAEYLINHRYTSARHLALTGGSAGGIAVGRAFTERPDLFAAVIDEVGASDTLRAQFSPNGVLNIPEFGDVNNPADYDALYNMDTYLHVKPGIKYPAVLLTTGINDSRVAPWQPAKLTAALQAANPGGNPILLRVDYAGGHGYGDAKAQYQQQLADEWSFALWQLGAPDFQPKRL